MLCGPQWDPLPTFEVVLEDGAAVPHACARPGDQYKIRVCNCSGRHIACHVTVDGEGAILKDGSLIVAPHDRRDLPGFLVSKNFVGKAYVKEYRNFQFGKPDVVEAGSSSAPSAGAYSSYGSIRCEVYQAVLDEELDSDQEVHGQTTFYRGTGLNGDFESRVVPEGKKKHLLYSSVTTQGPRSSLSNTTRGRWWVRGRRHLRNLEVRYREVHSLMLLGVEPQLLGLDVFKEADGNRHVKREEDALAKKEEKEEDEKEEKEEMVASDARLMPGFVQLCDLTAEDCGSDAAWTLVPEGPCAESVEVGP